MKFHFQIRRKKTISDHLIDSVPRSTISKSTKSRFGRRVPAFNEIDLLVETKAGGELASVISTTFTLSRSGNLVALNNLEETGTAVFSISDADLHVPVRAGTRSNAIEEILAETVMEEVARVPRTLKSLEALFVTSLIRSGEQSRSLIPATLAIAKLMLEHPVPPSDRSAIVGFTLGSSGSQLVVLWELTRNGQLQKMEATPRASDVQDTIRSFSNSKRITSVDEYERAFELVSITLFDTKDLFEVLPTLKSYPRPGDWFGISKQKLVSLATPYVMAIAVLALAATGFQGYRLMQLRHDLTFLAAQEIGHDQFGDLVSNHTGALLKAASVQLHAAIQYAKEIAPSAGTVDIAMVGANIKLISHQSLPSKPGIKFPTTILAPPKGCKQDQVQLTLTELKVTYACSNLAANPVAVLYRSLR